MLVTPCNTVQHTEGRYTPTRLGSGSSGHRSVLYTYMVVLTGDGFPKPRTWRCAGLAAGRCFQILPSTVISEGLRGPHIYKGPTYPRSRTARGRLAVALGFVGSRGRIVDRCNAADEMRVLMRFAEHENIREWFYIQCYVLLYLVYPQSDTPDVMLFRGASSEVVCPA